MLTSSLKMAKRDKKVRDNAATEAGRPGQKNKQQKKSLKAWNEEEARTAIIGAKAYGAQTSAFFALALDSGGRKGELQGLRWTVVDLIAGTMHIERQLMKAGPEPEFGPTKTREPRSLDIDEQTVTLLREHKREQAELKLKNRLHYADHGLVFAQTFEHDGGLGLPLTVGTIAGMLRRLIRSTNVRRITVHGLRHTSATLLLAQGEQS